MSFKVWPSNMSSWRQPRQFDHRISQEERTPITIPPITIPYLTLQWSYRVANLQPSSPCGVVWPRLINRLWTCIPCDMALCGYLYLRFWASLTHENKTGLLVDSENNGLNWRHLQVQIRNKAPVPVFSYQLRYIVAFTWIRVLSAEYEMGCFSHLTRLPA